VAGVPLEGEEAVTRTITTPYPGDVRYRQIETLARGDWWLGEYYARDGAEGTHRMWARVSFVTRVDDHVYPKRKIVKVFGIATDGECVVLRRYLCDLVPSVTAAQAARAGMELPQR
jgi:hypothetical protein